MMTFTRGFKSIYRNPARSLIVIFLLSVCLAFSMAMLAVRLAADSQVEEVKARVGNYAEVKVSSNVFFSRYFAESGKSEKERQREQETMTEQEARQKREETLIPESITDEVSRSEHVRTYDKFLTTDIVLPELENTNLQMVFESGLAKEASRLGIQVTMNTFPFTGNTDAASLSDFRDGKKVLVEGRYYDYFDFSAANPVVLIEKNLADKNQLRTGDTVVARIKDKTGREAEKELTIIGIYETKEAESSQNLLGFNPFGNRFYAPLSVVQELNNTPGFVDDASYYFDNVDNTNALLAEFRAISGSDRYEMTTDLVDYQTLADPLAKVGNTSSIGLWGSLGACVLILLLSMLLIVRGRVKELGVFKAVGAADRQILAQLAVEVVVLCLVAVIIASAATAALGQSLGNWLLSENIRTEAPEQNQKQDGGQGMMRQFQGGGSPGRLASDSSVGNQIKVLFGNELFLYACLILLGVCLTGMVIPVVGVVRVRPARVLRME